MSRPQPSPQSREDVSADSVVVRRIADREDCPPTELPPLYDVIDPDALNTIVDSSKTTRNRQDVSITFTYCGYEVNVGSAAEVRIGDATEGSEESEPRDDASVTVDSARNGNAPPRESANEKRERQEQCCNE